MFYSAIMTTAPSGRVSGIYPMIVHLTNMDFRRMHFRVHLLTVRPPPISEFHEGLPNNFERWPEAVFLQNKPTTQAAWQYVDQQIGRVLSALEQVGTNRDELTSHVDFLPLILSLASGGNKWREQYRYSQWASRADLFTMLSNPCAKGRDFILHTSDEDIPEEGPKVGLLYSDVLVSQVQLPEPLSGRSIPTHVIGYRTKYSKLGVYSNWMPGTIEISSEGQEYELYDYAKYGMDEVTNNAPGGPMPETELFIDLYREIFDPKKGAIVNELRQSLPRFLQPVQRKAIADYLTFEAQVQGNNGC